MPLASEGRASPVGGVLGIGFGSEAKREAMPGNMHVLSIPSWYHADYNPGRCRFFHDHALAVQSVGVAIRILFPDLRPMGSGEIGDLRGRHWQTRATVEEGIETVRYMGWSLIPSSPLHGLAKEAQWVRCGQWLGAAYVKRFGKPDLIHAHALIAAGELARRLARTWGVPWMFTEHSVEWMMEPAPHQARCHYAAAVASEASAAIAVSSALSEALRAHGLRQAPMHGVIPNPLDVAYFTPPDSLEKGRDGGYRFVYVGTVDRTTKRTDVLLRAFARAAAHNSAWTLDVVGGGDIRALQGYAMELGIGDRVRWHGFLQKDAVRQVLWNADAMVHPSRWETFGVAVAEGVAAGLPVVATACGGVEDILTADLRALKCAVVPVDAEDELAWAMSSLAAAGHEGPEVRRRRSDLIRRRSSLRGVGEAYARVYADVLGARHRRL